MSDTVLWHGPPAPWSDALGAVAVAATPGDVEAAEGAGLVVLAAGVDALGPWLRRPRARPPVVVVAGSTDAEDHALEQGAEAVLPPDATAAEARRAARHARARHTHARTDAELYRLMVESVTDLVSVTDADGDTIYASPSAYEQVGRTPEQIVAEPTFERIHEDDLDDVLATFMEGFLTGEAKMMRYRIIDPEGKTRTIESRGRAVLGPGQTPYGIVTSRDVTERARTEKRLVESEARYRTVVRALPDVVSRLRRDGLVLDFHVPALFATEFPAASLIGKRLQDVIPAALSAKFEDAVARLGDDGETVSYDYDVEVSGRTLYREVRMAAIGDDEVLSLLRDVTPLREHELALERSRAELRALATHLQDVREEERTRLSREVHDVLGQQLTAIRFGVGWFARHFADDAAAQSRLAMVRDTIDETIRHVRQIAADLRPGVLDDFGLASAVDWQAKRFTERTETPCEVVVEGDAEPPTDIATAAFRVLQEALTNVARHAEAGHVTVRLALEEGALRLVVEDDGVGFSPDPSGRRSLGLVGMRERAGAHGGTVEIRSRRTRGTVVECTLPFDSTPPSPPSP